MRILFIKENNHPTQAKGCVGCAPASAKMFSDTDNLPRPKPFCPHNSVVSCARVPENEDRNRDVLKYHFLPIVAFANPSLAVVQ